MVAEELLSKVIIQMGKVRLQCRATCDVLSFGMVKNIWVVSDCICAALATKLLPLRSKVLSLGGHLCALPVDNVK